MMTLNTMRPPTSILLFLLSAAVLVRVNAAGSWQYQPSPSFVGVHAKDILNSRSMSTIASSTMTAGRHRHFGSGSSYLSSSSSSSNLKREERVAEDVRGGSIKAPVAKQHKEPGTSETEKVTVAGEGVAAHHAHNDTVSSSTQRIQVPSPRDESKSHNNEAVAAAAADEEHGVTEFKRSGMFAFLQANSAKKTHTKYAKKLKNRNHTNLKRKVMHACYGIGFSFMNHMIPRKYFVPGMFILSSGTLLMELLRYKPGFHWMNDALHFVLGKTLRKHEMDGKFTGAFYFFTGVTMTAYLFDRNAATLGIVQLALADPSASYFGRATRHVYWSRIENGLGGIGRNKGVLGFLGGALFCFPFNYRVLSVAKLLTKNSENQFIATMLPGGKGAMAAAALLMGLAGAFADLCVPTPALTMPKRVCGVKVPPLHVDDNFVVPVFSAFAITKIFQAFGWSTNGNIQLANMLVV